MGGLECVLHGFRREALGKEEGEVALPLREEDDLPAVRDRLVEVGDPLDRLAEQIERERFGHPCCDLVGRVTDMRS